MCFTEADKWESLLYQPIVIRNKKRLNPSKKFGGFFLFFSEIFLYYAIWTDGYRKRRQAYQDVDYRRVRGFAAKFIV